MSSEFFSEPAAILVVLTVSPYPSKPYDCKGKDSCGASDLTFTALCAVQRKGLQMRMWRDEVSLQVFGGDKRLSTQKAGRLTGVVSHRSLILPLLGITLVLLFISPVFVGLTPNPAWAVNASPGSSSKTPAATVASQSHSGQASAPAVEAEAHGLSQKPVEIARVRGFPITNSMIVSWIVALGLILFAQYATRNMKQVPEGAQNFLEWLVEGLYKFLEGVIGGHLAAKTFWFFGTIFIFILAANWAGLIPGVGTIGWGHQTSHGFVIDQPMFRGANADVNMTFAMAAIFFVLWLVWSLQEVGVGGFLKDLFGPKGEITGVLKPLIVFVFFAAGFLEIISILFRPISLCFRLYGNVFAGENMLVAMASLVPGFGWLVPIPFYFLELLMGLVQALVFMLLTAVFTVLSCQHEEEGAAVAHS